VHEPRRGLILKLCGFLGVPFAAEMLDPHKDSDARMTDAEHRAQYSGDLKFHLHVRIEPDAADRWKKFDSEKSLSSMTRQLAAEFGY
jgi:hypothetical protein